MICIQCVSGNKHLKKPSNDHMYNNYYRVLIYFIFIIVCLQYVRLSDSTKVESIWNMMKNFWSLKEPNLILSIIGGNSSTNIDLDIKQSLENGLAKVRNF